MQIKKQKGLVMKKFLCSGRTRQSSFTLIELQVSSTLSSLHFFEQKFFRTAGHDLSSKSIPLFLKREVGFGERGKTSFPARSAGCEKTRPSVFVSLRRDESLRWGSDIPSQRSPLFLKREVGFGERGKTSFPLFPRAHLL